MYESQFGFRYSWSDLKPVRPLVVTTLVAEVIGAGYSFALTSASHDVFDRLWIGGALAVLPGFVLGLLVQRGVRAEAISENRRMVWRLGLVAAVISLVAVAMLTGALPSNTRWSGPHHG